MIESNYGPSGWSSCSANVFFLLFSPAYVSSPSLARALSRSLSSHGHNSLQNSTDLTSSFRVFVVFVFCYGFQEQEFVCCTFAAGCSESPTHIISKVELHQFRGLQLGTTSVFSSTPVPLKHKTSIGSPSFSKNIDERVRFGISMLLEEKPTFKLKKILE